MQTLDVISVNLWQILISLINLVLLFLIVKKFLFGPIKVVMEKRRNEIESGYESARRAMDEAESDREKWSQALSGAKAQADEILQNASDNAKYRGEKIISDANARAESIIRTAKSEAELERKKAEEGIKREIIEVSGALTEKMLEREINTDDHKNLIDSFIKEIGDSND